MMSSSLQQCHQCRHFRPTSCSTSCDDDGDGFFFHDYGYEDGNHITFHIRLDLSLSTTTSRGCHADNSTLLDLKLQSAHHDTGSSNSNNNRGEVPSRISNCITYIINKMYTKGRCNRHTHDPYDCKLDFEYLMTLICTYAPGLREAHLVYDVLSTTDVNLMTRMIRRDLRNVEMSNSTYQLVLCQRDSVEGRDDDVIDFVLKVKTNNGDHRVSAPLNQAEDYEMITCPMENVKTDDDTERRSTDDRDVSSKCKTTETAKDPSSSSSCYRNGIPPALATAWEESTKEYARDEEQEKVAVELTESDNIDDEKTGTLSGDTTTSLLIKEDDSSSKEEKDKKNKMDTKTNVSSVDEVVGDGPTKGAPKRKVETDETSGPEKMAKNAQKRVKIDDESGGRSSCNDAKDKASSDLESTMSQDVPQECAVDEEKQVENLQNVKNANNFSSEIMSIANATSSTLISEPNPAKKRGKKRSLLNAALEEHDRMITEETKENERSEKKSESISGEDNSDSSSSSSSSSDSDSDSGSNSSSSDSDNSEDEKEDGGDQNVMESLYSSKTEVLLEKNEEEVGNSDPVGAASSQHSTKSSSGSSSSDSNSSSDSSPSSDSDSESSGEDSSGDGVQDGEKEKIIYNVESTSIGGDLNERMNGAGVAGALQKNSTSTRRDSSSSSSSSNSSDGDGDGDSSSSSSSSDSDSSDEEEEKERKTDQSKVNTYEVMEEDVDDNAISTRVEESNYVGEEDSSRSNKFIEENLDRAGASSQQSHQSSSESSSSNSSTDSSTSSESETSDEESSGEEEQEEQRVSSVNDDNSSSDVSSSALNLSQFSALLPTNLFERSDTQQAPGDDNERGSESSSSSSSDSSSNASSEEQSQDLLQLTDTEEQKNNQKKEIGKTGKSEEETIELSKTSASNSGGGSSSSSSSSDSSSSGSSSGSESSDSDEEEDEMGCAKDIMQLNTSQNDKIDHPRNKNDSEDEIPGTQNSNFPTNRGHFPSTSNELLQNKDYSSTDSDSESSSSSDSSDSDSSSSSGSSSSSSSSDNEGGDDAGRKDDNGASTPELASDAAAASVTSNKRRRRTPLVPLSRKIVVSTIEGSQIQSFRRA